MADQRAARPTPTSNDPVDALIGEFIAEKRKEKQEEQEKARKMEPGRHRPLILGILVVLCVAVWAAPIYLPSREVTIPTSTLENSAKLNLYLASIRVRDYQAANRKLPDNLAQAGVDTTGIVYWRSTDAVFELSTRIEGTRIVYRSTVPDSVFLGPNLRVRGIS